VVREMTVVMGVIVVTVVPDGGAGSDGGDRGTGRWCWK